MCFGGGGSTQTVTEAVAPPAPEATPEEIIAPEETAEKSTERKQNKTKAKGLDNYRTDVSGGGSTSGLNVPQ